MSNCACQLSNVSLRYRIGRSLSRKRYRVVFDGLSLDVSQGETVGIAGPNGAGKSTLLMLLAGTLSPDKGTVINRCAHPALLTMNFGIAPSLPGRMNAILHALYLGYTKEEISQKMAGLIKFSGLDDSIDDPFYTYSTGMRARLAFSVVASLDADLLLIDELLGVGDAEFRAKSRQVIESKVRTHTSVIVSHDERMLRQISNRIYWLENSTLHPY